MIDWDNFKQLYAYSDGSTGLCRPTPSKMPLPWWMEACIHHGMGIFEGVGRHSPVLPSLYAYSCLSYELLLLKAVTYAVKVVMPQKCRKTLLLVLADHKKTK